VLSHAERRRFDAITRELAVDPAIARASRAADRRARRRRVWRWLAPLWVDWLDARRARRRLAPGY
jgi:hypothetical protein